jgi:hypothetical protein
MSSNFYSVGLNHVGAYQVAGTPFFERSALPAIADDSLQFQFPKVTKRVVIQNNSNADIRVHFVPYNVGEFGYTEGAVTNNNFFIIPQGTAFEMNVKCKEVFVSCGTNNPSNDITLFAELTNIPASRMYNLEGLEGVSQ